MKVGCKKLQRRDYLRESKRKGLRRCLDQFLKSWAAAPGISKKQPGFISAQLHRGITGSSVFVAYVVFE
jgi:hypothetical protein